MGKIAFLFAGQGSQYVGMGADLINKEGGIFDIMFRGPEEELNKTINTQPAIFLHSLAVAEKLRSAGIKPDAVAGFSLGEVPALCFAGAFDSAAGLELITKRAQSMQSACDKHGGAMVAVLRMPPEKTADIAKKFVNVWPVNFNSPEQTVCACSSADVDNFIAEVTAQGGRAVKLKVSGAFHCRYMDEACDALTKHLKNTDFAAPKIPVYANQTAKPYAGDMKKLLATQVNHPVLWTETIKNMCSIGIDTFVEVGPGAVLTGLVKKIAPESRVLNASDMASIESVIKELS